MILPSSLAQAISEPDSEIAPISAPTIVTTSGTSCVLGVRAQQLDRRDRRRRAAAHAVVQRDHLRHRGHRDALALHQAQPVPSAERRRREREVRA